jgi:hypothetical protein
MRLADVDPAGDAVELIPQMVTVPAVEGYSFRKKFSVKRNALTKNLAVSKSPQNGEKLLSPADLPCRECILTTLRGVP